MCPVCTRACDLKARNVGTLLSVEQQCPHCEYHRQWNSQPVIGSTPAGNLHLSAAVYLSGASFFKMKRVNDEKLIFCLCLYGFDYDVTYDPVADNAFSKTLSSLTLGLQINAPSTFPL